MTRGDGRVGEDVTENARTIRFPAAEAARTELGAFETRGEVVMNRHGFERLNDERELQGLPKFANPRNAAAGSLAGSGTSDHRIAAARLLRLWPAG